MILDRGRRDPLQHAGDEPEGRCSTASPRSTPCSSAPARRAARSWTFPDGTRRATASTSASTGWPAVAFGHIDKIGERVLIIGVGNTAMDCCRTSRRLGGKDVKVMARRAAPVLQGVALGAGGRRGRADRHPREPRARSASSSKAASSRAWSSSASSGVEDGKGRQTAKKIDTVMLPGRRRHPGDRSGERVPVDRARHRHRVRQGRHAGRRRGDHAVDAAGRVLRRRLGVRARRTSSGPSRTRTRRRSRSTTTAAASRSRERPPQGMNLITQKMGLAEWSYSNDYNPAKRAKMKHVDLRERFTQALARGRAGLRSRADRARGRALPQLRRADGLHRREVHRVRRLHRRLPDHLPHDRAQRRGGRAAQAADRRRPATPKQELFVSGRAAADRARDGEGRGRLRALRPVRRALPDGGVGHAEVRPQLPHAGQNGAGAWNSR